MEIILIFDDGPDSSLGSGNRTQRVLNTLKDNDTSDNIRGVFFIQSHSRNSNNGHYRGMHANGRAVLAEALSDGHLVDIHTGADLKLHTLTDKILGNLQLGIDYKNLTKPIRIS